jgi:hypothetical protein
MGDAAPMTHSEWLAARQPVPHERIVARVEEVLAADPSLAKKSVADALLVAADVLLASVLSERTGAAPRDAALDLLAADACVTWAFEAGADEPVTLGGRAAEAMRRFTEAAA